MRGNRHSRCKCSAASSILSNTLPPSLEPLQRPSFPPRASRGENALSWKDKRPTAGRTGWLDVSRPRRCPMMCVVVEWQRNIRISPLYPSPLLPVYYRSHRHTHTQFVQKLVAECCRQYTPVRRERGAHQSITAHQTTPHACHHKRGRSSIRYVEKCSRTRRLPPRVRVSKCDHH